MARPVTFSRPSLRGTEVPIRRGSGTGHPCNKRLPRDLGGIWILAQWVGMGEVGAADDSGGLGVWGAPFATQGKAVLRPYKGKLEAVGSQDGGHFQDAAVVVVVFELGAGLLIDDEGYVGMVLQGGGGDAGGDWAFDGLGDGRGFGGAAGQEQNSFCFKNRAYPHGDGAFGDFFAGFEKFAIVVGGFFAEDFQARAGAQA